MKKDKGLVYKQPNMEENRTKVKMKDSDTCILVSGECLSIEDEIPMGRSLYYQQEGRSKRNRRRTTSLPCQPLNTNKLIKKVDVSYTKTGACSVVSRGRGLHKDKVPARKQPKTTKMVSNKSIQMLQEKTLSKEKHFELDVLKELSTCNSSYISPTNESPLLDNKQTEPASDTLPDKLLKCKPNTENDEEMKYKSDAIEENKKEAKCMGIIVDQPKLMLKHAKDFNNSEIAKEDLGKVAKDDQAKTLWKFRMTNSAEVGASSDKEKMDDAKEKDDDETEKNVAENEEIDSGLGLRAEVLDLEERLNATDSLLNCEDSKLRFESLQELEMNQDDFDLLQDIERRKEKLKLEDLEKERKKKEEIDLLIEKQNQKEVLTVKLDMKPKVEQNCGMIEGDNRLVEEVDNRYQEHRDRDDEETNLKKMMDPAVKKQPTMQYDNNLTEKMDLSEKTVTENNVWHVTDEDHSVDPNTCRVSIECDDGFNEPRESDESDDAVENSCFFSQDDTTRPYSISMTMGSYGDGDGAKSLCIERNQYMENRGRSQYGQQYMVDDQGNKRSMYSTQTWCSEECIKNKILGTEKENMASNENECEKEKVDREKIESGENSSNPNFEALESDEGEKEEDIDLVDYTRGQYKISGTEYRDSLVREIDTDTENIATNEVHLLEAKEKEFVTSVDETNVKENELDVSDVAVDDEEKDNSLDTELSSKHLNKLLSDKEMIRHIQARLGKMIEDEYTKGEELVQLIKTKYQEIWTLNVAAEHTPIDRELDIMVNQSRMISHNISPGDEHKQGHADTTIRSPTCSKQRWPSPCLPEKNFAETSTEPDKPRKDRRLSMLRTSVYGRRCSNSDSGGSGGGHHSSNTGDSNSFNREKDSDDNNNSPNDNANNKNNKGRDYMDGHGDNGPDDGQNNMEKGNKDVEEANLPPKDYKHFPPGGEHREAKGHNPMDAIQWANYLGRLTQETNKKGGPIWELHDPDVSVCVSLCLLQPDEMTSDMLSCYICNTVNSLLKHYADCQAVYNSCNMCVQIFSLICSHSYHCGNGYLSNNSDGNPSNSANPSNNGLRSNTEASTKCQIKLCTSIHIHIDSRQFSMHLKTLWCHVRKKLAQMIGSASFVPLDAPAVLAGPPTVPPARPIRTSFVNPPSLESIPEGAPLSTVGSRPGSRVLARKKSKLLNVVEQSPAIESANSLPTSTSSTAEFARALTGELSEFALAQDAFPTSPSQPLSGSSEGSDSFGFVNRQQFVSVPVGPPPGPMGEYYPSFTDRPVGVKGIGEVVYHDKNQLVLVANHFDRLKVQYQNGEPLAKHYREEGVILRENKDKLCIEGLRYNINFQWLQLTHLGNGMSGKCHLAQDFKTEFNFCVKELHISNYEKEELELWCECDHPYIVQIYGAIRHGEKIYIFMEFVEGGCLTESINVQRELGHRLSQKTALRYFQQLLQVLTYLKGKRILHEDLKADNILLNKGKGKVSIKVADFGLSRRCQATVPKGTKPVGTQTQWSPEKAEGVGYSFSAELWSAICVLVHMLSGLPPWIRRYETIKSLILVIVDKSPPIEDIPRNIDESIKDLIERGFTVCAGQRPTSEALLLHSAFRLLQDDTPTADNYSIIGSFRCMSTQINDDPNADLREIFRGLQDPKAKPNFPLNPMTTVQAYPAMMNTQTLGGVSGQLSDSHNNAMGHNLGHNQHQNSNQSSNVVGASAAIPMNPLGNIDPLEHINSFLSDDQNIYPRPSLTVYLPNEERQNNKSEQHKTSLDIESDVEKNVLPNFDELGISQFEFKVENFDDDQQQEEDIFEDFDLDKEIGRQLQSTENSRSGSGLQDQEVNMQAVPQGIPQGILEEKLDTIEDDDDLFKSGPSPTQNALTNPLIQAINHTSERRIAGQHAVYPPNTEYQANYTRPKVYSETATRSASYQHQNPSAMNNHGYSGYTVNNDDEHLNLAPYLSQAHQQEVMQSQHAQFQYVTELNPGSNPGAGIFVGPSMTDDTSRLPGPTPRHELKENMNARNEMLKNQSKSSRPNLQIDVKKAQSGPVVYPITQSQTAPTFSPPKTPHYYKQTSVIVTSKQTRPSTSSSATTTGSGAMSSKSQYEEEQEQALKLLRDKMNDTLSQHSDHLIWNHDDDEDDDFIDNETNVMERSHTQEDLLEEFGVDLDNPEQSLAHLLDNSIDDGSITVTLKSRSNSAERRIKFTWRDKDKSWYKIIDEDLSRYSELYTDFSVTRFCLRQESAALVDLDDKLGEISLTVYVTEATDDDKWCVESGMIMHS